MKLATLCIPLACVLALPFNLSSAHAETIEIPIGQQGQVGMSKPSLGMTMDQVESDFGQAQQTYPSVGQPPITRWEYPSFTVYFEYKTVIHSVSKPKPETGQ